MHSPQICLISLGCPKNLVDAEMMLGSLKQEGFGFTQNAQEGDVIVVNTCGFIEDSKKESINQILEMAQYKEKGRCQVLIATGCLSQRYAEELTQEFPEVDLFVGTGEFDKISGLLRERFNNPNASLPRTLVSSNQILPDPDLPRVLATPNHYSYLKISEGCSHICSFCIIPAIRGRLKSRPMASIVREVSELVGRGVKEFNMIAQDLNEYGRDLKNGTDLAKLLEALNGIPGDFWLRPHYMYPLEFNDRLIDVLCDSEHIVKYVDMPLQHISERVLLSMKRGSPGRYVRQLLTKLKTKIPGIALRTTFIVGYPGETDTEFQELYDFLKEYEFDRVGAFQYSPEEGTSAATLTDQLPAEVKKERHHRLMSLQQEVSLRKNQALVGRSVRVLCEGRVEGNGYYQTRMSQQAPDIDGATYLLQPLVHPLADGEFARVKITGASEYDLFAEWDRSV